MIKYKYLSILLLATTFVGCVATAQKDSLVTSGEVAAPINNPPPPPAPVRTPAANNQIASPDALSRIQSQLTALQEQVIKLSGDTLAILQLSQLTVANGQMSTANQQQVVSSTANPQEMNGDSLNEILKKLEDIAPSPTAAFGIVSSYTASKQWVLIRFDRYTGETWLADNRGWNALGEQSELSISQYDVHLIRADQDKKGYVASRIDQRTGDTWWLNKKQWVVYQ